jgi:predicted CopG family antitoxin
MRLKQMVKPLQISDEVYYRLKAYTNDMPGRSRQKISFSEAIRKLLDFREGN